MGFLDNTFNKQDYLKFGITEAQAKEIDMLDGTEDNKINGKSIFEAIQEAKQEYDSSSTNQEKSFFDYLKNMYKKSFEFTDFTKIDINSLKFFGLGSYPPEEVVDELIEQIYKLGGSDLSEPINKITADNVVEVLQQYKIKSDEKNAIWGKNFDDETLFEAILDESISNEKKKEYIIHIKDKLVEKINNMNGNTEFIGKAFDKVLDEVLESSWGLQDASPLNQLFDEFLIIIDKLDKLNKINDTNKDVKLEISLQNLYKFCQKKGLSTNDLYGNGRLDSNAVQMTGNCILHADINAMLVTDKGKQYLNNLIVKDNALGGNGNITVYLPGAAELCVPENNPGYFTYSPEELINRTQKTSLGDGDYTAIICAVEDCRKLATGDETATSVQSSSDISVEYILFKQEKEIFIPTNAMFENYRKKLEKNKEILKSLSPLKDHTAKEILEKQINKQETLLSSIVNYDKIKEMFDSKNYAIMGGVVEGSVIKGVREEQEIILLDEHSYAVIEMNDTTVLLQESNNPKSLITVTKEEYIKMSSSVIEIFLKGHIPDTNEELRSL